MRIRKLQDNIVNRIAAGEVIERPASVVKELIENALDAGTSRLEVVCQGGGRSLIRVTDNGFGMAREDLELCVERHCTSKLDPDNFMDIRSLGFRGEALASIGAISHLRVTSRLKGGDEAWKIAVSDGHVYEPEPARLAEGTVVEVRDLFFSVPARLKFLKTERTENTVILEAFRRLAMVHPGVEMTLTGTQRAPLRYPAREGDDAQLERLKDVLGAEFTDNALFFQTEREGVKLEGFAGLPTLNRTNTLNQFFFINARPVRDKLILGAVKGAYGDFLARDRHAQVVLFVTIDPLAVDVNVHPSKAEVRFRDSQRVRGLIVSALRAVLSEGAHKTSSTGGAAMLASLENNTQHALQRQGRGDKAGFLPHLPSRAASAPRGTGGQASFGNTPSRRAFVLGSYEQKADKAASADFTTPFAPSHEEASENDEEFIDCPLGVARAQLHENYVIAQTKEGLVIVDQHAAHERLVYEGLKNQLDANAVETQMLLIPEVIELEEHALHRLLEHKELLARLGLVIEAFGGDAVVVREVPCLIAGADMKALIRELTEEVAETGAPEGLSERINQVLATLACYGSVRSGRRLKVKEMNALLRGMEATPHSGQCNHGRPTYIELKLKDIERLFGRT